MQPLPRVNVLGVGVSAVSMAQALDAIDKWIRTREPHYICVTGVHGVIESQRDPVLRRIHNAAGLVTPDGMTRGYRHFLYGGAEGVPELLADRLRERFPGLQVVGVYSPPFRPLTSEEDAALCRMVDDARPDIVWVGLSTPKQERWMAAHVGRLSAPVLVGVGAAFDFHAGLKRQAPRWMQRSGLEWLFRLLTEPRRLWRRYLLNNPLFVWYVALQMLGLRRIPLDGSPGAQPDAG